MIERLGVVNQVSFKGSTENELYKNFKQNHINEPSTAVQNVPLQQNISGAENVVEKKSIKEKLADGRKGILNIFKGFTKLSNTTKGFLNGLVCGTATTGAVGFVGKNLQKGEMKVDKVFVEMFSDVVNAGKNVITKAIPAIWNKSPKENISAILKAPSAFYKYCESGITEGKGNKKVAIIATLAGLAVLTYNTIKGHLKGNHSAAEIDHYTDNGHVKS